jgi:hypothetical protein
MKAIYRKFTFAMGFGFLIATSAEGQILINPGFETGDTAGWTLDFVYQNPEKWQIVSSPVHEGEYALLAKNWPKSLSTTFEPI